MSNTDIDSNGGPGAPPFIASLTTITPGIFYKDSLTANTGSSAVNPEFQIVTQDRHPFANAVASLPGTANLRIFFSDGAGSSILTFNGGNPESFNVITNDFSATAPGSLTTTAPIDDLFSHVPTLTLGDLPFTRNLTVEGVESVDDSGPPNLVFSRTASVVTPAAGSMQVLVDVRRPADNGFLTGVVATEAGVFDPSTQLQNGSVATTFTLRADHPLRVLTGGLTTPPAFVGDVNYTITIVAPAGGTFAGGVTSLDVAATLAPGDTELTLTGYELETYTGPETVLAQAEITRVQAEPLVPDGQPLRTFDVAAPGDLAALGVPLTLDIGLGTVLPPPPPAEESVVSCTEFAGLAVDGRTPDVFEMVTRIAAASGGTATDPYFATLTASASRQTCLEHTPLAASLTATAPLVSVPAAQDVLATRALGSGAVVYRS